MERKNCASALAVRSLVTLLEPNAFSYSLT